MTKQNGVDVWPNAAIWMRDELRLRLRPQLVLVVFLLGIVDYCSVALNCRSFADILSIGNVLSLPKLT